MTDPTIEVEPSQLQAEPGCQAVTVVTVRNQGTIVDGFHLTVLGDGPPSWAVVEPPDLRILPNEQETARVTFTLPAGTDSVSGSYPFGILAVSTVDPDTSAATEGDIEVGSVYGLRARLSPVSSTGRWRGRHILEVTNWGNSDVRLQLTADDPDNQLGFLVTPPTVDIPVGATGVSQVRVRTRYPKLRGQTVRRPFQVLGTPAERDSRAEISGSTEIHPQTARTDGAFTQRPILSKWFVASVLVVALAAVSGIVLAFRHPRGQPTLDASGSPHTPVLTVTALDSQSIELQWAAEPNVSAYTRRTLTADGNVTDSRSLDGALTISVADKLRPRTMYCFELAASRGGLSSLPSSAMCATTAAAPAVSPIMSSTTPSKPASSGAPPSTTRSSAPSSEAASVPVVVPLSPAGSSSTAASSAPVSDPASSPSASRPVSSPIRSAVSPPNGIFTATQRIAVVRVIPIVQGPSSESQAKQAAQSSSTATMTAGILLTSNYPNLGFGPSGDSPVHLPSYLVYFGPYSLAEAEQVCAPRTDCQIAVPGVAK